MPSWLATILIILGVIVALFLLLFCVYFFNLDMKLTSALQPLFEKHYDKVKKNRRL